MVNAGKTRRLLLKNSSAETVMQICFRQPKVRLYQKTIFVEIIYVKIIVNKISFSGVFSECMTGRSCRGFLSAYVIFSQRYQMACSEIRA